MFEAPRQWKSAVAGSGDVPLAPAPPAAIDLRKIWAIIWRGKATILATTAAALVLALLFLLLAPRQYTATTQILIDPTDLRAVANELNPSTQVSDTTLLQVESQVRVLTSDNVLRRVVDTEGLAHDPDFLRISPLRDFVRDLQALFGLNKTATATDPTLAALNELRRRVTVRRAERTYVVDVSVTADDPAMAARLANAVAEDYLTEQTQVRADAARRVSQALTARLNELKDRVREAEERVETFKARNNIVGANGQLVNEQQLSDLNNQLSAARARTAAAKARLDQIEAVQKSKGEIGAFPEAVQSPTITALRSQYAEIMRREAEQMSSLGARHPAVIEIQAQAERLQRMIDDEIARIARAARIEYESAKADEELLGRNVDALKQTAIATNESMVGLRELERDVQAGRAVYEAYLVRARETGEQERVDTKNIQVISKADLPMNRTSPPSTLLMALGAIVLGFAAGAGLVVLRATQQQEPPPRGLAPPSGKLAESLEMPAAAPRPAAEIAANLPVLAELPGVDVAFGLDSIDDPTSRFAAGIRSVYEELRAKSGKRGHASVLLVASEDGDDNAAVALTLAAAAAATQRVLLIDADLERRTLSAIDADQSEAGLVDVAMGSHALADAVVRDSDTNVNLLPFVAPNTRRDRRIEDDDIKGAFAQTKQFDMVIVSATHLSRAPSTRFFAGLVDHIVLVIRADEAGEKAIEDFLDGLGLDARKVRGAVLTEAKAA